MDTDIPAALKGKVPKDIRDRLRQFSAFPSFLRHAEAKALVHDIAHLGLSRADIMALIGRPYHYFERARALHGVRQPRRHYGYSDDALRMIVSYFMNSKEFEMPRDRRAAAEHKQKMLDAVEKIEGREITFNAIRTAVTRQLKKEDLARIGLPDVELPLSWGTLKTNKAPPPLPPSRQWPEPEELVMDTEKFARPGVRIGLASRIDYRGPGFRKGMVIRGAEIFCAEGCQFFVINAGLVHKQWVKQFIGSYSAGMPKDARAGARDAALDEIARGLSFVIPRVRHPTEKGKYIRWYITPSLQHDGTCGDLIAQKLQMLRSEDIRVHDPTKGPLAVKGIDKLIGVVNARRNRLPSEYHSNAAERDIKDFETQTARDDYDIYAVGGHASCIYNPRGGERTTPYVTIPALHRLQGDRVAENQEGVCILNFALDGASHSLRVFPLRDWSRNERACITGIKEGAKPIHQKIVDVIKRMGAVTIGVLDDELGVSRAVLEKEIQFLVESRPSLRKTWPGLYYSPASQTYGFHLEWIQETLRYPKLSKEWTEHRILEFGCLHAGYRTTDYEHFVTRYPAIILARNVDTLVGVGDFIAGLHHDFLCTGEVFGGLNNDEQEELAAELVATVMMAVFRARSAAIAKAARSADAAGASVLVERSLLNFVYTIGNHDNWQSRDGSTPLDTFRGKLVAMLTEHIQTMLADLGLPATDVARIVRAKVVLVSQHRPHYEFPSKVVLGLHHPYMARAKTSSLRAQEAMKFLRECHIIGAANFHTSIFAHSWEPSRGQRLVGQVGTMVIGTSFEMGKMKRVDFGPLYLGVRAQNGRVIMTETEAFPDPILRDPIPKGADPEQLKTRLGLLRAR